MKQRLFDDNIIDLLVQNIFQRFLDSVARFWDNIAEHPQKSCKICLDNLITWPVFGQLIKFGDEKLNQLSFFILILQNKIFLKYIILIH